MVGSEWGTCMLVMLVFFLVCPILVLLSGLFHHVLWHKIPYISCHTTCTCMYVFKRKNVYSSSQPNTIVRWLGRVIHCTLPLYVLPLSKFHSTPTSIAELPFYNIRGAARKTRSQAYSRIWERAYCRMRFVCIASCHRLTAILSELG